jgi:hypothetical protein
MVVRTIKFLALTSDVSKTASVGGISNGGVHNVVEIYSVKSDTWRYGRENT